MCSSTKSRTFCELKNMCGTIISKESPKYIQGCYHNSLRLTSQRALFYVYYVKTKLNGHDGLSIDGLPNYLAPMTSLWLLFVFLSRSIYSTLSGVGIFIGMN